MPEYIGSDVHAAFKNNVTTDLIIHIHEITGHDIWLNNRDWWRIISTIEK